MNPYHVKKPSVNPAATTADRDPQPARSKRAGVASAARAMRERSTWADTRTKGTTNVRRNHPATLVASRGMPTTIFGKVTETRRRQRGRPGRAMERRRHYLVVVGAGSGGFAAARTARDLRADVALVDQARSADCAFYAAACPARRSSHRATPHRICVRRASSVSMRAISRLIFRISCVISASSSKVSRIIVSRESTRSHSIWAGHAFSRRTTPSRRRIHYRGR